MLAWAHSMGSFPAAELTGGGYRSSLLWLARAIVDGPERRVNAAESCARKRRVASGNSLIHGIPFLGRWMVPHRPLVAGYMAHRAWVGDMRAARRAGHSPARAPMSTAAPSPPAHASAGMTTSQPLARA